MKVATTQEHHEIEPDGLYLQLTAECKNDETNLSRIHEVLFACDGITCGIGSGPDASDPVVLTILLADSRSSQST